MKKLTFLKTFLIIVLFTYQSKPQFLTKVCYASTDTIFAAGWDIFSLYKSTNAGESWFPMNFGQNNDLLALEFISPLRGFTAISANIWWTSDGGNSWDYVTTGNPFALLDISFYDSLNALAVGTGGKIIKSTDVGQSWQLLSSGTNKTLFSISFPIQSTAIAVGGEFSGDDGIILKTTDFGTSWEPISSPIQTTLRCVSFAAETTGFAVGYNGAIIRSTDSGSTWTFQNSQTSNILNSCYFVTTDIGFAVGSAGIILKTTNSGQNWELMNSNTSRGLQSIKMQNELIGVVVGSGIILKTTDGGNSWIQKQIVTDLAEDKSYDLTSYKLMQNYPNPFNPSTKIKFTIPSIRTRDRVFIQLIVYDVLGNEIATLINEELPTGEYEVEFNVVQNNILSSGIYFYQIRAGTFVQTRKMVLMK